MPPQLSLPMGIAMQHLPGGHRSCWAENLIPSHFLLSVIDLGQYVSYAGDGTTATRKLESALSLGGQIGYLFGSSSNAFSVALDFRYAPGMTVQTAEVAQQDASREPTAKGPAHPQGSIRWGISLSYYVPFFDFN